MNNKEHLENLASLMPEGFIAEISDKLMMMASDEEALLYCKVYESSPEEVLKELGKTKDSILKAFIKVWMGRYIEKDNGSK